MLILSPGIILLINFPILYATAQFITELTQLIRNLIYPGVSLPGMLIKPQMFGKHQLKKICLFMTQKGIYLLI